MFYFTLDVTSGYNISLIRDPARGTSQLNLHVAWTSAFKQFFHVYSAVCNRWFFSHGAEGSNYYGATDLGAKSKLVTWWKRGSVANVLVCIFLCLPKKYVSQE